MRDIQDITVIGAGAMGGSIVRGLVESKQFDPRDVVVTDPNEGRLDELEKSYGVITSPAPFDERSTDAYVIAVKPGYVEETLKGYQELFEGALIVSIVAGLPTEKLEELVPKSSSVVRVMPNLAAAVGESMSVVARGRSASREDSAAVVALLESIGQAIEISETQLDIAGAISGCGPAYTALVVDALTRAGVSNGLPAEVGRTLALQTLSGSAELLKRTEMHPRVLMEKVSSPAGTTVAALDAMDSQVEFAFRMGVEAALKRSHELAGEE